MKNNKKRNMTEASWELFMKTGDPFYFVAKNTFEKIEKEKEKEEKLKEENGLINN